MKFLCLFDIKENVSQAKIAESIAKRSEYKFPEGTKLLAEYWTAAQCPSVVAVIEATDPSQLMLNSVAWMDVFEVRVTPCLDWHEASQKLAKAFPKK